MAHPPGARGSLVGRCKRTPRTPKLAFAHSCAPERECDRWRRPPAERTSIGDSAIKADRAGPTVNRTLLGELAIDLVPARAEELPINARKRNSWPSATGRRGPRRVIPSYAGTPDGTRRPATILTGCGCPFATSPAFPIAAGLAVWVDRERERRCGTWHKAGEGPPTPVQSWDAGEVEDWSRGPMVVDVLAADDDALQRVRTPAGAHIRDRHDAGVPAPFRSSRPRGADSHGRGTQAIPRPSTLRSGARSRMLRRARPTFEFWAPSSAACAPI